jgi:membrane associated rhomboid family serine protease
MLSTNKLLHSLSTPTSTHGGASGNHLLCTPVTSIIRHFTVEVRIRRFAWSRLFGHILCNLAPGARRIFSQLPFTLHLPTMFSRASLQRSLKAIPSQRAFLNLNRRPRTMPSDFFSTGERFGITRRDDYFIRAFSSTPFKGPSYRSAQAVIWTIIGLNTLVFSAWTYAKSNNDRNMLMKLYQNFTLSKENFNAGRTWTLVTSAFSHNLLPHFAFNMFAFHALASIMSYIPGIGGLHIVAVGLGSAIVGSAAWLYDSQLKSQIKGGFLRAAAPTQVALGASGLVMGIGAAAACLRPFSPMQLMFIPVNIPLWIITLGYAAADTYFLHSASPVGHAAHLGGSVFGLVYYFAYLRRFGGVWNMITKGGRK